MAAHCEAQLQHGRVQFLLCHGHEQAPSSLDLASFVSCEVGRDELLPVCAPDAQGRSRFDLDAAPPRRSAKAALPMLAYSTESGLGRVLRSLHGAALEAPGCEVVFTAHLATVLRSLALEGRGLAFLPGSLVPEDLAAGQLVPAGGARWTIALSVRLCRPRAALSAVAERMRCPRNGVN